MYVQHHVTFTAVFEIRFCPMNPFCPHIISEVVKLDLCSTVFQAWHAYHFMSQCSCVNLIRIFEAAFNKLNTYKCHGIEWSFSEIVMKLNGTIINIRGRQHVVILPSHNHKSTTIFILHYLWNAELHSTQDFISLFNFVETYIWRLCSEIKRQLYIQVLLSLSVIFNATKTKNKNAFQ